MVATRYSVCMLAAFLSLAVFSGSTASAQDYEGSKAGDFEFTLGGQGASDSDFDVGSGGVQGSFGWLLSDHMQLSVRQTFNFSDFGDSAWGGSTRGAFDFLFPLGSVRPFVGANFGWVYGDDTVKETLAAGPEAGIKWWVTEDAFIFGQMEYQFFFEDVSDADDAFDDGSFVYSLGLGIHF